MISRLALLLALLPLISVGQRQIIGRAIDSETKLPIKNIVVSTEDNKSRTLTNQLGFFEIAVDETIKKLTIDHVSYGLSEVTIPEQNKFTFALSKRDLELPLVDLRSFGENSKLKVSDDSTTLYKQKTRPVSVKGGFAGLFNYLGNNIQIKDSLVDKFICLFPDTVFSAEVHFTVTKPGKVANVQIKGDTLYGMGSVIANAIRNTSWEPALQEGEACDQNLRITIYYGDYAYMIVDNPASLPAPGTDCPPTTNSSGNATSTRLCVDGYYKYINENIQYPAEAKRKKIAGSVIVQFVINKKGKIVKDKIKVVRGLGYGLDQEAIRLISNCPDWKPASQKGTPVYQSLTMPVTFRK